ncbi:MAG TPA: CaiB/BaiF CoA-transferase family protein [Kofleriaceae bacterium]|nr:CaiB/BaiF CoA-transferase family protein [Kofleriaceae bacterium]
MTIDRAARPLDGIRVLDLSRLLPGPFLTMVLGDMGADVVKIEDPRIGDYMRQIPPVKAGMSGRFLAVNRGKRSLALDLKAEAGRGAFLRMVERADVVVESFRPGVMARLGVGWDALAGRNPRVILCSISGYGQDGPYVERAGHDLNYLALAGVLAMGGTAGAAGGAPGMPGVQIADLAGGALWGATAVLGALVGRARTGRGAHLDISMTEGALALLAAELGNVDSGGHVPTRGSATLNGGMACYGVYETADGKYVSVGALEPKFWLAFNRAIGRREDVSELVAPPGRQAAVRAEVQAILRTRTRDEWAEILASHDCCCEPVLEIDEILDHPVHRAREVFTRVAAGGDSVLQVRTPVGPARTDRIAPLLGEHSREVLAEYGFGDGEIRALCGDGDRG